MQITLSDDFIDSLAERLKELIPSQVNVQNEKEIMTEEYLMTEVLDVSANTLKNYRVMGLQSTKIGNKRYYLLEDVKEFLKENQI